LEAYKIMHDHDLTQLDFSFTEEILSDPHNLCPEEFQKCLFKLIENNSLCIYLCEPYAFLIGSYESMLFLIDTHPVPKEAGGNGNGLVISLKSKSKQNVVAKLMSWITKRMNVSGVREFRQSLSVIIHEEKNLYVGKQSSLYTNREFGGPVVNEEIDRFESTKNQNMEVTGSSQSNNSSSVISRGSQQVIISSSSGEKKRISNVVKEEGEQCLAKLKSFSVLHSNQNVRKSQPTGKVNSSDGVNNTKYTNYGGKENESSQIDFKKRRSFDLYYIVK